MWQPARDGVGSVVHNFVDWNALGVRLPFTVFRARCGYSGVDYAPSFATKCWAVVVDLTPKFLVARATCTVARRVQVGEVSGTASLGRVSRPSLYKDSELVRAVRQ